MNKTIFGANSGLKTSSDVSNAIGTIDVAIQQKLTKTIFRDLFKGLKILTSSMQQPDKELAFNTTIQWLKLYLRVENALSPTDSKLRKQFEKYIPPAVSHIAVALFYKHTNIEQYHFHLLKLSLALLKVVTKGTLKKVANLNPRLIACFWKPINFVGDFNTQVVVLRLIVKLLKCIDDDKRNEVLEKIFEGQKVLKRDIDSAVEVSKFQTGRFKNIARKFLNNFNNNLSRHVLVYSMRCEEVKFGDVISFYKPLHAEHLWIDVNYCPGTVSFNGRCKADSMEKFINVEVCAKIHSLKLNEHILTVVSNAPPYFSKTFSNPSNLFAVRILHIVLLGEEAQRLLENESVLKYYECSENNKEELVTKPAETISDDNDDNHTAAKSSNYKERIENKENDNHTTATISKAKRFAKSFPIMTETAGNHEEQYGNQAMLETAGIDEDNITSTDPLSEFKLPSLSYYENALIRSKLSQQQNKKDLSLSGNPKDVSIVKTRRNTKQKIVTTETSKSSRSTTSHNYSQTQSRSIVEHTPDIASSKHRFFKTIVQPNNNNKDAEKKKKPKRCRTKKQRTPLSPPQRKQVNKFSMYHLAKSDGVHEEKIQEYVENGGILKIKDFLLKEMESTEVFTEDERRIILQNVDKINNDLERSVERFFRDIEENVNMPTADIFDIFKDHFAEPGRSYRHFKTLKPKANELKAENLKLRRKRTLKNNLKSNIKENNDQEAATAKATETKTTKRKTRKRPKKKPKAASGVVDNTIPSNANDFPNTIDADSAANGNKKTKIRPTNSNEEQPEKPIEFLSNILCTQPESTGTYSITFLSSDDEFNDFKIEVMPSSENVTAVFPQNDILESRHDFVTVEKVKPNNNEPIIIPTTRELPNGQNDEQTNCSDIVFMNDINLDIDNDEIEIPSQAMGEIINILERTESQNETPNEPLDGWKEAHYESSSSTDQIHTEHSKDRLQKFFQLIDIQESRQAVVSTEQVTSDEEFLRDIFNINKINEPKYSTLKEQPGETAKIEDLNREFTNIDNCDALKSNLERKEKSSGSYGLIYRQRSDEESSIIPNWRTEPRN